MNWQREAGASEAFERRAFLPTMLAIVGSLGLAAIQLFATPSTEAAQILSWLDWFLWGLLALEFGIRLYLSLDRSHFVRRNLVDLAVVALPVIPLLRALRLLRLLRVALVGARVADQAAIVKRGNVGYALLLAVLVVFIAGVLVWSVERDVSGSDIQSLIDALWWALATVTTVGYGDAIPVSDEGRAIAVALMIVGIAVFGLVSATLASIFVDNSRAEEAAALRAKLDAIEAKLDRIGRAT